MSQQAASPRMVVSDPAQGKASTVQLNPQHLRLLLGKKIGDMLDGSVFGFKNAMIKITGGTDRDGFPMRPDVSGPRKVKILLSGGVGYHPKRKPPSKKKKRRNRRPVKGVRKRVTVRGNVISEAIAQVNAVLVKKEG
ncbi:MAG: S6e family ribosomal protein [Candidatus Caldarchaeum sp.]|uniref:Small ribosomal subunit protein eS6 n=1 Tax=Caldiarchaeum subterraneum TaxID=311458 RepID=A0A7C5LES5_CALS0